MYSLDQWDFLVGEATLQKWPVACCGFLGLKNSDLKDVIDFMWWHGVIYHCVIFIQEVSSYISILCLRTGAV